MNSQPRTFCRISLLFLLGALSMRDANSVQFPHTDLVAYYPFTGNANDETPNQNNGTVYGASLASDRFGAAHNAYSFDGDTSYIELPDSPVFHSLNYTVSLWFNATRYPNSADHDHEAAMLISHGRNDFELHLGAPPFTDTGFRFLPQLIDADTGVLSDARSASFALNTWYNLVATFRGDLNESHLYLNGVELSLTTLSGPDSAQPSGPARLGMRYDGSVPFQGSLDDVRIYSRALAADEVATLFANENASPLPEGADTIFLLITAFLSLALFRRQSVG